MERCSTQTQPWQGIHRATLERILLIRSPLLAFWSLDAWLSAPLGRWPAYPFRWVRPELARGYGVSRSTVTRAKVEALESGLWEVCPDNPNQLRAVRAAWPEPNGQWYALDSELRTRLSVLARMGRHNAWRSALWLLVRLRAAWAANQSCRATNERVAAGLGFSESTASRAVHLLELLGLVRVAPVRCSYVMTAQGVQRPPRMLLADGLLAVDSVLAGGLARAEHTFRGSHVQDGGSHVQDSVVRVSDISSQEPSEVDRPCVAPARARAHARVAAGDPVLSPAEQGALSELAWIGVLDNRAGRQLARLAGDRAGALRWLETEGPALATAHNPPAWLVRAASDWGSRPDTPSPIAVRQQREAPRGCWFDGQTMSWQPFIEAEPLPELPPPTPAAVACETAYEYADLARELAADDAAAAADVLLDAEAAWRRAVERGAEPRQTVEQRTMRALDEARTALASGRKPHTLCVSGRELAAEAAQPVRFQPDWAELWRVVR